MPSLFFITDQTAQPCPERVIESLPESAAVILRDYDHERRAELGEKLHFLCTQRNIRFLVAKDIQLALQLKADGLHLPEFMTENATQIKEEHSNLIVTVSCHSEDAATRAYECNADAILFAPVFATESHPNTLQNDALVLGSEKVRALCTKLPIPIYALGGMTVETVQSLKDTGVAGVAGIRGF